MRCFGQLAVAAVFLVSCRTTPVEVGDARFAVHFPDTPYRDAERADRVKGTPWIQHYTAYSGDYTFNLSMTQHDSIPRGDFDSLMKHAAEGLASGGVSIVSRQALTRPGLHGQEVLLASPGKTVRAWTVVQGDRLYGLTVVCPKGHETSPEVLRFLESFRLKQAD